MQFISAFLGLVLVSMNSFAADASLEPVMRHDGMHHGQMHGAMDNRTSLNLPPEMKQHQLSNMRSHLEAVQAIADLLSRQEFDKAAQVAHSRLGLTDAMKKMCGSFGNEKFEQLGLAFHKSADELGDTLSTRDMSKSLEALNTTMGYCVQCHATFRQ